LCCCWLLFLVKGLDWLTDEFDKTNLCIFSNMLSSGEK